jgi:hypothetical protein
MTTRTPTEIFEEVLALWEGREMDRILCSLPKSFTAAQLRGQEDETDRLLAQVRAYREEFREAMAPQRYDVTGPIVEEEVPPRTVVDDPVRPDPPPAQVNDLMAALKASLLAAEANRRYGAILPPGQPVKPPRVGPGDHSLRPEPDVIDPVHVQALKAAMAASPKKGRF